MTPRYANSFAGAETEQLEGELFTETPFYDGREAESEEVYAGEITGEFQGEGWEYTTPFLPGEANQAGELESESEHAAIFSELFTEMKDELFREALEQLADEALEHNADRIAGEYGDHETRDAAAAHALSEHFRPLATQADSMLEQFFERLEAYEAESLTDSEIARIGDEVLPAAGMRSPASEQFLGGLLNKAKRLASSAVKLVKSGVSGAVQLAGKGLAAVGKLALKGLLEPLKRLGKYLLQHVVQFALGQLPPALRPLGQTLAQRLFHAIGETAENEGEEPLHSPEALPAAMDAGRLEAEFDLHAAQLLFAADEAEMEHIVASYGEAQESLGALRVLDDARVKLTQRLAGLGENENPAPVMEQFVPAMLWSVAKTAISILGRPKLVTFLGNLLGGLIKPLVGAKASGLLAPAIADAGLRIFGLEAEHEDPRMATAEALAATIEETLHRVAELPPHVLENETLLSDATHEAFETAAASYFPNSAIRAELHESEDRHGRWVRTGPSARQKRYAVYNQPIQVRISPRLAAAVPSFGRTTLRDHLDQDPGFRAGRPYTGTLRLYQALPGVRASTIARKEGFPVSQLHPLTPYAAGLLLGPNAALGTRPTPDRYQDTPHRLHVNQRLYRIESPLPQPRVVRQHRSELAINLQRGEIRLWLYLNEPLCQKIALLLDRGGRAAAAYGLVRPQLHSLMEALRHSALHRHLPAGIFVISRRPDIHGYTPHWLRQTSARLAGRIHAWAQAQLAQYFRNNGAAFRAACQSHHDGVTLRITMTDVPGMPDLAALAHGRAAPALVGQRWPAGSPRFHVVERVGYSMHRLRD